MARASAIHSCADARRLARRRLPWMVFDYIDGAAGEEHGAAMNRAALRALRLRSRVLVDVSRRDLSVPLFGAVAARPFGISPMAMGNLACPGADLMMARFAARDRVPLGVSTLSSTPMETLLEAAEGHAWFQLYFSGDGSDTLRLVDRARDAGYPVLVLTLDVPELGRRPRELRHDFKMPFRIGPRQFLDFALHPRWSLAGLLAGKPEPANFRKPGFAFDRKASRAAADWSYLARLRDRWPGKLVAKGVLDTEDALRLRDAGVDAIQVSSHGGRQLDAAVPPILALRAIRAALGPDFPLFYDSGIHSGEDVVKAYAMGADFVFLGRVVLFALAAAQEAGLTRIRDMLSEEIEITLAQTGQTGMRALQGICLDAPRPGAR